MMTNDRWYTVEDTELTVETREGSPPRVVGYAAVFDSPSEEMFGFREVIQPGAFSRSLADNDDVVAMFNHDPNLTMARRSAGTLELQENKTGLKFRFEPPDTQPGRDLVTSIRRGDIRANSFGFQVHEDGEEWTNDKDGGEIRQLTSVRLFDVSPVTFPAYPGTDGKLALRSRDAWLAGAREQQMARAQRRLEAMRNRLRLDQAKQPV
jgi:uncharacterized protein